MKFDCRKICILPRITTISTSTNRKFFIRFYVWISSYWFFEWKNTPLCNFCNKNEETPLNIVCECTLVIYLATNSNFFESNLILPALTLHLDYLFWLWSDNKNHDNPIINQGLIIFKLYMYNSRKKHHLNIMNLLNDIKKNKKDRIPFTFQQWKKEKYIIINSA